MTMCQVCMLQRFVDACDVCSIMLFTNNTIQRYITDNNCKYNKEQGWLSRVCDSQETDT